MTATFFVQNPNSVGKLQTVGHRLYECMFFFSREKTPISMGKLQTVGYELFYECMFVLRLTDLTGIMQFIVYALYDCNIFC